MVCGEVTKVDESAGKITIKHAPIKKFDMEAMTMVFQAQDPAMLKQVKAGDKIKFEADKVNGQFTVMKIESGRRRDFSRRPPTPPCVGFPTRRFMIRD
jgi:Cu(I)/Ag(I) efflux system protein CusF